jgi:type IV pilus assembly protein PilC
MVQCLQALADQTSNKVMRDVIRDVCTRVEGGDNFSSALHKHPKVFDRLYVCMVDAGEKGGLLAEILARLATYLENTARLRKKVKSAMMYPTAVTVIAIGITTFLLIKVVPVFAEIFSGFGAKLPAPTQFLIDLSNVVKKYFVVIILAVGGSVYGWFAYIKTKRGREFWDRTRIKLPIFGHIAHKICVARFSRTLASLIRSGVPILEVLNIVANTCGNVIMEKAIRVAMGDIEKGEGISAALSKHPIFPVMIIRMMTAGEQTGKIDAMLERVADFLDEEIETTLAGLTSLIEPLLIVFLGVIIGGMVVAMFLPIFKMSDIINPPRK